MQEGADLLAGEDLGKTRSETEREKEETTEENGADENGHTEKEVEEKPSLQRAGTMQVTAEVSHLTRLEIRLVW